MFGFGETTGVYMGRLVIILLYKPKIHKINIDAEHERDKMGVELDEI